jgi:3-hydroxybutyryl-CoA dehydrogenase
MAPIDRVVVLGSGRMAPGIAAACAIAGADVVVAARDMARAAAAAGLASGYSAREIHAAPIDPSSFERTDCVIEAIAEDADLKRALLAQLEGWVDEAVIVATNTSSFSISALAEALRRPDRFAGFHFLNPAHETAVVEVVAGNATDDATVEALSELGRRMRKLPLVVRKDVKGFIWNRLQLAVLRESLHLLEEGVADIEAIDAAISDGLAPRWVASGPFATADLGGIHTWAIVASELFPVLSNATEVPASLRTRAESGGSFYRWTNESQAELADLRAEILRSAMTLVERRRSAMPEA